MCSHTGGRARCIGQQQVECELHTAFLVVRLSRLEGDLLVRSVRARSQSEQPWRQWFRSRTC